MQRIRLNDLTDAVRLFFSDALQGEGFVIEDEAGQPRGGFVPYHRPSDEQKQRALADLRRLWRHTDKAMRESGVAEDDIDRVLQEDD
jgi:hypothetical protein